MHEEVSGAAGAIDRLAAPRGGGSPAVVPAKFLALRAVFTRKAVSLSSMSLL